METLSALDRDRLIFKIVSTAIPNSLSVGNCLLWPRAKRRKDKRSKAYGVIEHQGKRWHVHRLLYALCRGPSSIEGKDIHHTCGNSLCVRLTHLRALTPEEHGAIHAKDRRPKSHCHRGHSYNEANTKVGSDGRRRCRICRRDSKRAHYERNFKAILADNRARRQK